MADADEMGIRSVPMAGIAVGFPCPVCRHTDADVVAYREAGGVDLSCRRCRWDWTEDPYLDAMYDEVA